MESSCSSQAEARFRWRKKVVPGGAGQRLEKVLEEVKRSTRDSFEEEVAEVFTVQEAEEVFPDDFEDHLLLDDNDTKRDESDVNNSASAAVPSPPSTRPTNTSRRT